MRHVLAWFVLIVGGWSLVPISARDVGQFPVDEVRPGMVGQGVTVFEGTRRQPFTAHVIGVLRNVVGPQRHLILARLEGGPLATTGVIAGMSGSPVTIDGRLVGAVAYSLGAFAKEPIAGITPIGEMLAETTPALRAAPRWHGPVRLPADERAIVDDLLAVVPDARRFAMSAADVRRVAGEGLDLAVALRRIATPVALGGFTRDSAARLGEVFDALGLRAVTGWGGSAVPDPGAAPDAPLQGGDAIGISLVSGDLSMSATGTVTHVDGDRVYAFGHPLVNLGPVRMPMTRAYVHAVLPSLMDSFKISSPGPVVGTLEQDRATAVAGTLGRAPRTIPVRVSLAGTRAPQRDFRFELSDDAILTPTLSFFSILSVLQNFERAAGASTYAVRGQVRVKGRGAFDFDDLFAGDNVSAAAAGYLATPLTLLLRSAIEPVEIEGVDVSIAASEVPRTLAIERVWLDTARVRPGDTVDLRVSLRPWRAPEVVRTVPVRIPAGARGPLTLVVGDANRIAPYDTRDLRQAPNADNVPALLRAFAALRRNHVLYVRLLTQEAGVTVAGESLAGLPPSVLGVIDAQRAGTGATAIRQATAGAWDVPMDAMVVGLRTLQIALEAN